MATKTPKTYTISFEETKDFVEKQPKDDSYVGECGSVSRCFVARAIQAKYHPHESVVCDSRYMFITFQDGSKEEMWHPVLAGEDAAQIDELIHGFDRLGVLGGLATKADVLPLFEKVAA